MRSRSQAARTTTPKTETEKRLDAKEAAEYAEVAADKKAAMEDRSSIAKPDDAAKAGYKGKDPKEAEEFYAKEKVTAELSDKLDAEQADKDAAKRRAAASAPKNLEELHQSIGALTMGTHARIVDTLFDMPDPMVEYQAIRNSLTFGGRASSMSYGALVDALDDAQAIAERASRLLANAKIAYDAFKLDALVVEGVLREEAVADLQEQKKSGERSKQITNDDITSVMAQKFSDEYRALELKKGKAKRMVDAIEQLYDRATNRAGDLRTMVAKSREVS